MKRVLTIVFSLLIGATYGQSSHSNSGIRIKKMTNYQSRSFDIPDIVNDSTAEKFIETEYLYSEDVLVGIRRLYSRDNKDLKSEYDSIKYLSQDSVVVIRTSEGRINKFNLKLPDFLDLRRKVTEGEMRFYSDFHKILVVSDEEGDKIEYYKKKHYGYGYEDTVALHYNFDSTQKLSEIIESRSNPDITSWYRFDFDDKKLTISSGSGEMWHTSTEYLFNGKGLLIMKGQESDTNASITVYEYEEGKGNAGAFINTIYDVIYYNPLIK